MRKLQQKFNLQIERNMNTQKNEQICKIKNVRINFRFQALNSESKMMNERFYERKTKQKRKGAIGGICNFTRMPNSCHQMQIHSPGNPFETSSNIDKDLLKCQKNCIQLSDSSKI